jgi:TPR repeat protein
MKLHHLFVEANDKWDAGDLHGAFELLSAAASEGDAPSQSTLGYFYDAGVGVQRDPDLAMLWYRRAARQKDICATSNIAVCYRDQGDMRKARGWFRKALSLGDMDAALELGKLLLLGRTRDSVARAKKYLAMAMTAELITEAGREEAKTLMAELEAAAHG